MSLAGIEKYYIVDLNNKTYKINKDKALYVFEKLENKKIAKMSLSDFKNYLVKYDMFDEITLENFAKM